MPTQITNTDKSINEDSESITFNYINQFSENRYFGNDLFDSSPRIVFGIESFLNIRKQIINLKLNQLYQFNSNSSFSEKINQNSNLSDYSFEANANYNNILFKIDSRIDQKKFSKKEMNYSIKYVDEDKLNFYFDYNETLEEAFKNLSNDTQSIKLEIAKKLNNNLIASYSTNLDVKNNYDPFKSVLGISLFDECSQLDIKYSNVRFNDNYNTKPEEKISLSYTMDYLGFFGYEQSTNLFFSEPGELNYGF